ncbi:MAG TPA: ABC transporter ATP-binding protein [Gaiellaceae bacterium]
MNAWLSLARERLALRIRIARLLFSATGSLAWWAIGLNVLAGLLPVLFFYATSVLLARLPGAVGEPASEAAQRIGAPLAVAGLAYLLQQVAAPIQDVVSQRVSTRVDGIVRDRALGAAMDPDGIAHLEDQTLRDHLVDAVGQLEWSPFTPGQACSGLVRVFARYAGYAGSVILVAVAADWRAALILGAGAAALRHAQNASARRFGEIWAAQARDRREAWYFRRVAAGGEGAKEVRILSILPWLRQRFRTAILAAVMPVQRARRRILFTPFLGYTLVGAAAAAGGLALAAHAAAAGDVSIRGLAIVLQGGLAIVYFGLFFEDSDFQLAYGLEALRALERFEAGTVAEAPARGGVPAPAQRGEIRFEGVAFAYPGSERRVLSGLDLVLPAGRSTAIVGLNGAGKTTLVKLLGRLYEPIEGRIMVDGRDVRDFELETWRAQLAAIFQDFVRYELPAAENIAFGAADRELVGAAAARAGALELLESLPSGLATPLSRQYEGGVDLSGGEWQKVALARALYAVAAGASVLVLDEPTASLDARSEARFFDELVEMTRGLTTVLVSHRFATVRRADRIVVLEDGAIAEEGTHEELLALGGRYATLFRLQAKQFAEEAAADA